MSAVEVVALAASVLLGGFGGLRLPSLRERYLHLVLSFSGAYLLGVTALHLLPEAFAGGAAHVGVAVLGGFVLQLCFEQLSAGVEHGHVHVHPGSRVAVPVLLGLSLHAFLEGAPLGLDAQQLVRGEHLHEGLFLGILLHKLPAGFALGVLLRHAGYGVGATWLGLGVFAAMSPLGAVTLGNAVPGDWAPVLLGVVIGSLLHVSTTILFEVDGAGGHRLTWAKAGAIAAGIVSALLTADV